MENGDAEMADAENGTEQPIEQSNESIQTNQKPDEATASVSEQQAANEAPSTGLPPHLQVQDGQQSADIGMQGTGEAEETENLQEPRPNALLLKGVNSLDTRAIKYYIDHYVRPDYSFNNRDKYARFAYRLEWVNDESVNVVFISRDEGEQGAQEALQILTDESIEQPETLSATDERVAKPFVREKGAKEETGEDTADNVQLTVRQSLKGDRKVKNARIYSRYYLMHGEPDRAERMPAARERRARGNGYEPRLAGEHAEDLITGEKVAEEELLGDRAGSFRPVPARGDDREDDLFSYRGRGGRDDEYRAENGDYRNGDEYGDYRDDRGNYRDRGDYRDDRGYRNEYRDDYGRRDAGYRDNGFRDTWRPSDERSSRGERRRRRRRGRGRDRGDLFDAYRTSRDEDHSRRSRADEEDLFPNFFKRKQEQTQRDREESPSRPEQ